MPSPLTGKKPQIHDSVYLAPNVVIIGDVQIEEGCNIWFGVLIRGDVGTIKIGKNTSIQDNTTIHTAKGTTTIIGENCIISHHCMIHGPTEISYGCLVGIASRVLQNSKLGEGCIVGEGALLRNKEIPPNSYIVGIPAEKKSDLTEPGKPLGAVYADMYVENGQIYKEFFEKNLNYYKL